MTTALSTSNATASTARNDIDASIVLPLVLGVAFLLGLFAAFGVHVSDAAKYFSYLALFVAMPGISVLSLLRGPKGASLMDIGITVMPLGYAISCIGFVLCSALGLHALAPYASLLVGLVCAIFSFKRWPIPKWIPQADPRAMRAGLALTGLIVLAVLLSAFEFFPLYPLPQAVPPSGVVYQDDMSWHIGNAASLKSLWPPADLRMVGYPLRYYIAFHMHAAMASLVTNVEPAVIILRLAPSLFVAQIGVGLFLIGHSLSGRVAVGLLAVFLGLIASDLSVLLGATHPQFLNLFVRDLFLSPTYALGVLTIGPAILEIARYISAPKEARAHLILIFLLLLGLGSAKMPAMPVVVAGCAGLLGIELLRTKAIAKRPLNAFIVSVIAMAIVYPLVIFKSGSGYVRFSPLATIWQIPAYRIVLGGEKGGALTAPIRGLFAVFAFAPIHWAGLVAFLKSRVTKENIEYRFIAMVVLAAGSAVLLINGAGIGQIWFWLYGYVALSLVAAYGLVDLWSRLLAKTSPIWRYALIVLALFAVGSSALRAGPGLAIALGKRNLPIGPLTPERVYAYQWIRAHTTPETILAIDHQNHLYGSAITERRFLLENDEFMTSAYLYRFSGGKLGEPPNQELRALTRRVFEEHDEAALQEMKTKHGVRYLLDDKKENAPMRAFDAAQAKLVFSNSTLDVYEIAP